MVCGSNQGSSQHVLFALPCSLGLQIPPKDPEAWCLFVYTKDSSRIASGNARGYDRDNWL